MPTRILFFGSLKEQAGGAERVVELPAQIGSLDELIDWVAAGDSETRSALSSRSVRVAIDGAIVGRGERIGAAAEIAFMPAFSGG